MLPELTHIEEAMQAYPIPQCLWESLDAVLLTKGIVLAREIAAELKVSPKLLIKALNVQDRNQFALIADEEGTQYQCQALIQRGATLMRCRHPVIGVAPRICCAHEKYRIDYFQGNTELVQRVLGPAGQYFLKDKVLYNEYGSSVGILKKDSSAIIFELDLT